MTVLSNNRYKILVVEDDDNIRSLIGTILETGGYQMIPTHTCQMGQTLFASHNPDLAILDLGLPDADGSQFIRFVRESSHMPIIVLSARDGEQDKVEALDLGANDYVTKPFGKCRAAGPDPGGIAQSPAERGRYGFRWILPPAGSGDRLR